MSSGNVVPQKRKESDHSWQMLIELALPGESASASLAVDLVAVTVKTLNWSAANLGQLKQALAKATQNTGERSKLHSSDALLIIRVLVSEDSAVTQELDQTSDAPCQRQASERMIQQISQPNSRGWGFFLVQKQGNSPPVPAGETHHLIELFLYQESNRS